MPGVTLWHVLVISMLVQFEAPSPVLSDKLLRLVSELRSKQQHNEAKGRVRYNPEVDMNAIQLITSKGYPFESYKVVTEDGYILSLFRIPHGRNQTKETGSQLSRPAALLQHGLDGSCTDWLLNPANESLAFVLADAGADVWLGNSRGNIYSRNHTTLDPSDLAFWKFSWDEMAKYDLPAVIYFILEKTGHEQIFYAGHSQGTTIGFAQFGEDPKLGSKIKHFLALAPIGRVAHNKAIISYLAPLAPLGEYLLDIFGHGELSFPKEVLHLMASEACLTWGQILCENFIFVNGGWDYKYMNTSRLDVYISHGQGGTSGRDLLHWAQMSDSGKFQKFDYGEKENLIKYGQKTPPLYDPLKMKVPVAVFRGGKDLLADTEDVNWLLPQLTVTHDIYIEDYEHQDMTFAAYNAVDKLYITLVAIVMGRG